MSAGQPVQFLLQGTADDPLVVLRSAFWHFNVIGFYDGESACVVDPGIYPHEVEALRTALTAGGRRTVDYVLLTHSHHDHIRGRTTQPRRVDAIELGVLSQTR